MRFATLTADVVLVRAGLEAHVHIRERVRGDERDRLVLRSALVTAGRPARKVGDHEQRDDSDDDDRSEDDSPAAPVLRGDRTPTRP